MTYYFLLFIIYSFIGWIYESTLCSVRDKKLINRGFLNGPICPIYGTGALVVIILLGDVKDILALFLSSILLTGILEYLTSYLMEKLFHAKWWDYSYRSFNINGRVCLEGALVFGTLSVITVFYINLFTNKVLSVVNDNILNLISLILLIILVVDTIFTVNSLLSLNSRLKQVQEAFNKYIEASKVKTDKIKFNILDKFEESEFYSEKIKHILSVKRFQDKRIMKAFPNFKSTKYYEAFERIKDNIIKSRDNHKRK
ncbi:MULTISPECIES: putative ABC transporter permease [Clostridium]|uniref:ABC transporter permease n=1 Tax=Clostridium cibarium TaxID=2762247 RepID=A0ABR8PTR3_9CLOT|nr:MULTISPECIES: putative ABC transporter permease [Clostridium]MBD7911552.1 putative ABC transporter permease [Clostridium cibarium]